MSYIRGPNYIWRDDERVHIWAADGDDEWRESGWAEDVLGHGPREPDEARPNGVGLSQDVADLYVVMRFAELVKRKRVAETVDRAITSYGRNGGCLALVELAPVLRTVSERPPEPGD